MKPELENKLFEKYPKLFADKLCWGIECGDGWFWLIDELCDCIQKYIDDIGIDQVEVVQVKEKFGTLRFYVNSSNRLIDGMIWFAEALSYKTCEVCGSVENIRHTKGWIRTLCGDCDEGQKEQAKKIDCSCGDSQVCERGADCCKNAKKQPAGD